MEPRYYLTPGQVIVALGLVILMIGAALARTTSTSAPSWKTHVQWVDQALADRQISAAAFEWRDAYGAALGSRDWEAMLAVGDAALRIGDATHQRVGWEPKARQCYLTALFRAREHRSLDGVLRVAKAFAQLGDQAVVEQGIRIAERLARDDHAAQMRVREFAERSDNRMFATAPVEAF